MARDLTQFHTKTTEVVALCADGFYNSNRNLYTRISTLLAELIADGFEELETAKKLADGGPALVSPRFAYPHIQDRVLSVVEFINVNKG